MDATQWAGVFSFGLAAAACLVAGCRPWPFLAIVNAGFAAECALGWRHGFHDRAVAAMGDLYSERTPAQLLMMVVIMGLAAIGLLRLRDRSGTRRHSGAAKVTLLSATLFLLETISLHGVDALIYRPATGLLVIGWLWLLLGGTTVACAWLNVRRTGVLRK
ncbi:MAG: hypothetical protein JHC57_08135 [Sphingopyxis sp.]|uniref:hypothetical protein n=1 Tax=Sphingopyxis sp. TaxID=1908224 RepID=UPI001A1E566A|nr:hypothetical protein [Sphingopyxis sp.]MBJ7499706.1 hypothetical protein [Sphingopyxis sp.]